MNCVHCGTAIADAALICYRCGEATRPAHRSPPSPRRRRWGVASLSLAVVAAAGLSIAQVFGDVAPDAVAWGVGATALAALIWSLVPR